MPKEPRPNPDRAQPVGPSRIQPRKRDPMEGAAQKDAMTKTAPRALQRLVRDTNADAWTGKVGPRR